MDNRTPTTVSNEPDVLASRTAQYALLGVLAGILFPLLATIIKLSELKLPLTLSNAFGVQLADPVLWITDTAPFFLGLVAGIAGRRQDRVLEANQELVERDRQLQSARAGLEQGINERTQELDKRNAQMRAVIEFARQLADIPDIPSLLNTAADILGARFGEYEANLYLLEEGGHSATLRASSTRSGRTLMESGFRVPVSDQTSVGRVVRRGKLLVNQARTDRATAGAFASATQITLPLAVRGQVIGVLELNSREALTVGTAETEFFQLIADQLAASIENARLASTSRLSAKQLESMAVEGTRAAWQSYLKNRELAFKFTPAGVTPVSGAAPLDEPDALNTAILLRGQPIGTLTMSRRTSVPWSPSDRELADKVAAQVALALENARLLEETSQKAAQEQIISEISARLSRSLEVDTVLQAAVREFAALPEVAEAEVRLASEDGRSRASR